VIAQKIK